MNETEQKLYDAFKPGERLLNNELAKRTQMLPSHLGKKLLKLLRTGVLARSRTRRATRGGSREYEYYRANDTVARDAGDAEPVRRARETKQKVQLVAPPYPRVLINAPPADVEIGRGLWSHAQLALSARR